eukprot:TRINITY_DN51827_c0_g1_i1.p1 TRINITY_DN51827_c0_g1~~TRINITY_DN51827_c0_g1_i1.p1  ORF type:complete len:215 (+),score=83.74 TRINITY_DN51827_c0_g1_i1:40-684(+)
MKTFIAVTLLLAIANAATLVRIAHASPDAPAVDIYVDGFKVWDYVNFPEVSLYLPVSPTNHTYTVCVAGSSPSPATCPINVTTLLNNDTPYTIAAGNVLAKIQPFVYVDDRRIPDSGKAAVRFIHLSPNAPAVDILVAGTSTKLFPNVSFGTAAGYIQVPPGDYKLAVNVANTNTTVLTATVSFSDRRVYSVLAEGLVGGSGIQALQAQEHWDL